MLKLYPWTQLAHNSRGYDFELGQLFGFIAFNPVYRTFRFRRAKAIRGFSVHGFGMNFVIGKDPEMPTHWSDR